jgi:transcriptional regulator with XRE-family HTH domain
MRMNATTKRVVRDLERLRRERGLTQSELASQLGVSQAHLSRVISGAAPPGNKLEFRITRLLGEERPRKVNEWLNQIELAALRSDNFKNLVDAALKIMEERVGNDGDIPCSPQEPKILG